MTFRAAASPAINQLKARMVYFAVAIAAVLGMMNARSASAQYASQVNVPFAFSANHQAFPAGAYRLRRESENHLTLVSAETGISADLMISTSRRVEVSPKNSVLFLHDRRGYQLLKVRFAQRAVSVQTELTLQPKHETEIVDVSTGAATEIGMN